MKILYEIERLSTNGGLERILTDRMNYMAEEWGWDITVITLLEQDCQPYYRLSTKVDVVGLGVTSSGLMMCAKSLWKLNKVVKRLKPDIYVTFQTIGALSCLFRTHKTLTVYEAHGTRAYIQHPLAMDIAERFADAIVVLSDSHAKDYPKAKHIAVIPNFTLFAPKSSPNYQSKIVMAVGRRCFEKNFERLEELWNIVHEKQTDWQLKIHHDTQDMVSAYLESSILAMTSRFEAQPMVLIEAMTCGLPCIAFDCPYGPRDIIEDGNTGFLIPYDNNEMFIEKLTYLMEHPEVRERMGEAARESVKRFSVETIMEKWRKLYEG
ncbi:MAG: glycosyltransferase family 4 protein [Prevotella sp.]|nr:glycosyltransferase family 4 protein [Prevotella sp.]MBR4650506.1 glycosyltransferase family 4 protein [Prevotella sp.]